MTVREFISITNDSFMDLAVNEYDGKLRKRGVVLERHKWCCSDVPDDLLAKEISAIVPYYDRISIDVESRREA